MHYFIQLSCSAEKALVNQCERCFPNWTYLKHGYLKQLLSYPLLLFIYSHNMTYSPTLYNMTYLLRYHPVTTSAPCRLSIKSYATGFRRITVDYFAVRLILKSFLNLCYRQKGHLVAENIQIDIKLISFSILL